MKIKIIEKSYEEVSALPKEPHKKPIRQWKLLRMVLKPLCFIGLRLNGFTGYKKIGMEKLDKKEPCLYLMNCTNAIGVFYDKVKGNPVLFSGGVSGNTYIQQQIVKKFDALFAQSAFSSDNAAGIALLCEERYRREYGC